MCAVNRTNKKWLDVASTYAQIRSGCTKVQVGSAIVKGDRLICLGANKTLPVNCRESGCLRVALYGENSKLHRNPEDCRAIHSEIDAISTATEDLTGATIFITRYPCENCAKAIAVSGITKVVYGREQKITKMAEEIFSNFGVEVVHESEFKEKDEFN